MPVSPLVSSWFTIDDHVPQAQFEAWAESVELGLATVEAWQATRRIRLTSALTIYVNPSTGNNANTGLDPSLPKQTIQSAYNYLVAAFDVAGQTVTIQCAAGTYTSGTTIGSPWTGGGVVIINGNTSTPGSVLVSPTGADCFTINIVVPSDLRIQGIKLQTTTAGSGIRHNGAGQVQFSSLDFGLLPNGNYHKYVNGSGKIQAIGNWTISGGASAHDLVIGPGTIEQPGRTVTLTGTPAFGSAYALASRQGLILNNGMVFSGSATGPRYYADLGGGIFTNGGGANYFPGNSAGSATSPGWYN